ncbi:type VII secretion protein EccCb [Mycolicibacterium porcinum]|uniref:Type VII secretion protein EccCb n=1 Tax=Mycolicibacterium porcinum TaxID=39693 RepID=A0ABV3VIN0_9MYCO
MVQVSTKARDGLLFAANPDYMSRNEFEVLARSLSRYEPIDEAGRMLATAASEARSGQEYLDLWGIEDARTWDPTPLWDELTIATRCEIPLGKTAVGNKPLWLDIKQDAEGGVGPHGMGVGMTGSGKSKLARAIVMGLAIKHPPEMMKILLGDFKGEAEFTGLEGLPHVVGVVSNLGDSLHKLDRFQDVVEGEMELRQEALKRAGFESVLHYEQARARGAKLPPIGVLVMVLDEFSELLSLKAEMGPVFDQVGRLGRSLWVSILNFSQRAETGKMAGLIAQQSYAIGMKVKDAGESRRALGSPVAYDELRNSPPGSAILAVDGEYTKFRAYYTQATFQPPKRRKAEKVATEGYPVDVHRFTSEIAPLPEDLLKIADTDEDAEDDVEDAEDFFDDDMDLPLGAEAPTVESVLVRQIAKFGKGRTRGGMWLPALDDTPEIPLSELTKEYWGREWTQVIADGGLVVPIAREDNPRRHTQEVVCLDLSGAGGNIGITGKTVIGKSMTAQAVMLSLAHSHSPQRVQFYGLDFGGGNTARNMAGLPHVAGIAGGSDPEKVSQVVIEVEKLLRRREREWELAGININTFRARKFGASPEEVPDDGHGDVFLIVDNITAFKNFNLDLHDRVARLAENALAYGIHLVVTNDSWLSIKMGDKLGTQIELRLSSHVDSKCRDKELARRLPDVPGLALQRNGLQMRIGAPYQVRETIAKETEDQATKDAVAEIARAWSDLGCQQTRQLRMLPDKIAYEDMGPAAPGTLKLGLGQTTFNTVGIDIARYPHFWAAGNSQSGRSTLLRTLLRSITETFAPPNPEAPSFDQAQILLFESDFELMDSVDERYKVAYANTKPEILSICEALAQALTKRRPPSDLSDREKRLWRPAAPRIFVVVDDLDQLTVTGKHGGKQSALAPLIEQMARGQRIGFHVLATTQASNFYQTGKSNKVISAMDDAGVSALVMDSEKKETYVGDIKGAVRVPGRGEFWTRKGRELVQVAQTLPPDEVLEGRI